MKFKIFICVALSVIIVLQAAIVGLLIYGGLKAKSELTVAKNSINSTANNLNNETTTLNQSLSQANQKLDNINSALRP